LASRLFPRQSILGYALAGVTFAYFLIQKELRFSIIRWLREQNRSQLRRQDSA
jgi:hypothetical protein